MKYAISIVSCIGFIKHVYSYEILAKRLTSDKDMLSIRSHCAIIITRHQFYPLKLRLFKKYE